MPPSGNIYWLKVSLSFAMFLWSHIYKLSQPFCSDSQDTETNKLYPRALRILVVPCNMPLSQKLCLCSTACKTLSERREHSHLGRSHTQPKVCVWSSTPRVTPLKLLSTHFSGLWGGTLASLGASWGRSRQGSWREINGGSPLESSSQGEQPRQLSEDQQVSTPYVCHRGSSRSTPGSLDSPLTALVPSMVPG